MGTDIHLVVETNRGAGWELVAPPIEPCVCQRISRYLLAGEVTVLPPLCCAWCVTPDQRGDLPGEVLEPGTTRYSWWHHRNYRLFAVLANIRNSYRIAPVAFDYGLPDDITQQTRLICDDDDFHGHSWVTLEELMRYDWDTQPQLAPFKARLRELAGTVGEYPCRLVYAFDN